MLKMLSSITSDLLLLYSSAFDNSHTENDNVYISTLKIMNKVWFIMNKRMCFMIKYRCTMNKSQCTMIKHLKKQGFTDY